MTPARQIDSELVPRASRALVAAAVAGLLLAAPACSSEDDGSTAQTQSNVTCLNPRGDINPDATVTSTTHDPSMTLETFTERCDELGGVVELICHCGGANTCKGMSYDTTTQTLSEHTCRGLNTCAGYSCVVA